MPSQVQNFTIVGGESRTLNLIAKTAAGAIINLTGATLTFRLARNAADDPLVQKSAEISITSAVDGTFAVPLLNTETDDLQAGDYVHQTSALIAGTTTACNRGVLRVTDNIGPATNTPIS